MLELRKVQWLCGKSDAIIVSVVVVADRVDRAPDVHLLYGGHHDAKIEVAPVTCLELTLLTFAHLVLISYVYKIRIHVAHQQREFGLRDETAKIVIDEDATQDDTEQLSEREVERLSAPARLVQMQLSPGTVSLPSRLDLADLQLEMQRLR